MNAFELGQMSRQARDSESYLNRRSIQFRKKKQLYQNKPHHIQGLNGKMVCFVPTSSEYEVRVSIPGLHEPLENRTNVQHSYTPHTQHPNYTHSPSRYSANKERTRTTAGIVPMSPVWMEMTEKLKQEKPPHAQPKRKKSRKSRTSTTLKEAWPKEMRIRQVSLSDRKSSQFQLPSINPRESTSTPKKVTYKHPTGTTTGTTTGNTKGSSREDVRGSKQSSTAKFPPVKKKSSGGGLLIKDNKRPSQVHRDLRKRAPQDPGDRAEMFINHSTLPKWRSHWTGPL